MLPSVWRVPRTIRDSRRKQRYGGYAYGTSSVFEPVRAIGLLFLFLSVSLGSAFGAEGNRPCPAINTQADFLTNFQQLVLHGRVE